ncbi:MAG: glycosyltransferase [Planctomycetia bacterium]
MNVARTAGPLRVLLVSNGFPPTGHWGTEVYTHQLATGLQRRGHEVKVFCPRRDGSAPRHTLEVRRHDGIEVVEIHNKGERSKRFEDSYANAEVEAACARLCAEWRPQVVHFLHMLWGLSTGLPEVAKRSGAAVAATLVDYGLLCHRGQFRDWLGRACPRPVDPAACARCVREPGPYDAAPAPLALKRAVVRALAACGGAGRVVVARDIERRVAAIERARGAVQRWIAPTSALAQAFLERGWPRERVETLPYGIDEARFLVPPAPPRDGATIGFIGQFAPHKGADVLFEAVRLLRADARLEAREWCLELWGHELGDRHARYLEAHLGPDLAGRVRRMGPFEPSTAPQVMARFDALCVPSRWDENAPLVVLQARAAGLPIVASDVPGIGEVLRGHPARLVAPGDAQAWARELRRVVEARPPRLAPAPVVGHDEHLDAIERLYRELAGAA